MRFFKKLLIMIVLVCVFVIPNVVQMVEAAENIPYVFGHRNYDAEEVEETDPEMIFAILARLGQTIRANDVENSKRGLDLGLSRGYSGSQQAKHMMGIAAAGLSGGPGRRRRSQSPYRYRVPY